MVALSNGDDHDLSCGAVPHAEVLSTLKLQIRKCIERIEEDTT